jgi:hypothetical protein
VKGLVWSESGTPTLASNDGVTTDGGSGTGNFSSSLTGLSANQAYNVRAYATNSVGTGYGPTVTFTTSNSLPTVTGFSPDTRCGTGTVNLTAATSAGTIRWYDAATDGNLLATNTAYSPTIAATTNFYAEAFDGTCPSAVRTSVTGTFNAVPTVATTTPAGRYDAGAVTISATASVGNIKWYSVPTGGSFILTNNNYSPTISETTTYYAEAINGTCTSARSAVAASIIKPPGGVSSNLQYWVKADAGTNTTSDEAEVTSWTDQSANATSNKKKENLKK